nr:replication initiator protein A [uncultured Oscillibacter sp.]
MSKIILSDYLYGDEATQFTYLKMPRKLFDVPCFKSLSVAAKLLYGMLLDRMSLSARNGWHDDAGRVYIYYTVKEVCQSIGCGRNKAMRLLAELDTVKGIGLIERVKQGQGKPDKIFVKKISAHEDTEIPNTAETNSAAPVSEADFSDVQKSEIPTSGGRENRLLEVSKADPNKTNKNQTEFIQINLSILLHRPPGLEGIDRYEQREANTGFVRRAICAPLLCWTSPGGINLSENHPPGQSSKPAPLAAQSWQVCRLLNRQPLLGGVPPNTPSEMCPTVKHKCKNLGSAIYCQIH